MSTIDIHNQMLYLYVIENSVYQIRNTFKYVSYKHSNELIKGFKSIYKAVNEDEALSTLEISYKIR